jgi:hypothetical protein
MKDRGQYWWNMDPAMDHIVEYGLDFADQAQALDARQILEDRAKQQPQDYSHTDARMTAEPVREVSELRAKDRAADPTSILEQAALEADSVRVAEAYARMGRVADDAARRLKRLSVYLALEEIGLPEHSHVLDVATEVERTGHRAKIRVLYYADPPQRFDPDNISPIAPMPKQREKIYMVDREEWFNAKDALDIIASRDMTSEQMLMTLALVIRRRRG